MYFNKKNTLYTTLTTARFSARLGIVDLDDNEILNSFKEKLNGNRGWINSDFFVIKPNLFNLIENDKTVWEQKKLIQLAETNNLNYLKDFGFWPPLTLEDCRYLQSFWDNGKTSWQIWK